MGLIKIYFLIVFLSLYVSIEGSNEGTSASEVIDVDEYVDDSSYQEFLQYDACIDSVRELYPKELKTARDCYDYAFINLSLSSFENNAYADLYFGYILMHITDKKTLPTRLTFCEKKAREAGIGTKKGLSKFMNDCKNTLINAGFTKNHGSGALEHAYSTNRKVEFFQDPNSYPYMFFKLLYQVSLARFPDCIMGPDEWCTNEGYKRATSLREDEEESEENYYFS